MVALPASKLSHPPKPFHRESRKEKDLSCFRERRHASSKVKEAPDRKISAASFRVSDWTAVHWSLSGRYLVLDSASGLFDLYSSTPPQPYIQDRATTSHNTSHSPPNILLSALAPTSSWRHIASRGPPPSTESRPCTWSAWSTLQ